MKKIILRIVSVSVLACMVFLCASCANTADPGQPETTAPVSTSATTESTQPSSQETTAPETTEPTVETTEATEPPPVEVILEETKVLSFEDLCAVMRDTPNLVLFQTGGKVLTLEEYITLCQINEDVAVISKVEVDGKTMDLSADEINISKTKISDKALFDSFLSHAPAGKKFVMCDCGYKNTEMGELREKYPQLEFAWRIYFGKWDMRTDDEAFSVMISSYNYQRMTSADIEVLKYCTNLKALDLGHQAISDLSVIGQLTELRVLILADNRIRDISPLANLKNLEYVELFVNDIKDVSPLAECKNLVDLNLGWNWRVNDLSSLYSLEKLERLWLPTTDIDREQEKELATVFPNVQMVFDDKDSVSSGWRTHERYFIMRAMFTNNKYDEAFIK